MLYITRGATARWPRNVRRTTSTTAQVFAETVALNDRPLAAVRVHRRRRKEPARGRLRTWSPASYEQQRRGQVGKAYNRAAGQPARARAILRRAASLTDGRAARRPRTPQRRRR